jgi:hypothetical protein
VAYGEVTVSIEDPRKELVKAWRAGGGEMASELVVVENVAGRDEGAVQFGENGVLINRHFGIELLRVSGGGEIQQIQSYYSGDVCASLITREAVSGDTELVPEVRDPSASLLSWCATVAWRYSAGKSFNVI